MNFFHTVSERFKDWDYAYPKVLYGLILAIRATNVVEVGTYRGLGACWMARAIQEQGRGRVWCIDDFSESIQRRTSYDEWHGNLTACGVRDWATLLHGKSQEVLWPKSVDLAYIDGWHGYTAVREDFRRAASLGAKVICLDDVVGTVGPRMLVEEIRLNYNRGTGNGKWIEHEGISRPGHDIDGEWDVAEIVEDNGLAICTRKVSKPPVRFSQELPNNTGIVLVPATIESHLSEAAAATGLNYEKVMMQ